MHKQNFIRIHSLFLKILRKIETLTSIKGHYSVEKFGNISCVSQNTAYTKFHQNLSICSQDIKWNHNYPYIDFVNINAFTKFYQNPSTGPQGIEQKRNFDINQGP